jgi:hypothetical protein
MHATEYSQNLALDMISNTLLRLPGSLTLEKADTATRTR